MASSPYPFLPPVPPGPPALDLILVATQGRVVALRKSDGVELWRTRLPGMAYFVTLLVDPPHAFAHARGEIHCLDLASGQIIWSNNLPGCGYHLASLAIAGSSAPDSGTIAAIMAQQQQSASAAT
jgi:outer membrane protein assembly factor BamB